MSRATKREEAKSDGAVKPRSHAKTKTKNRQRKTKAVEKTVIKFRYKALDETGKMVSGVELAGSSGAGPLAPLTRGFQALEVKEQRNILKFEITKKKVPRKDVMNFSRQLAVFMKAGIPIMEALEVIVEETQGKLLKVILSEMVDSLRAGGTFWAGAAAHPGAFPNYYVGILESAELTCNLDIVLNQLADYIDRDVTARGKITAAL